MGATGVGFDQHAQLVVRNGWFVEGCSVDVRLERVIFDTVNFESSSHFAAYRADAFDVRLGGTRRAICVGSLAQAFCALFPRLGAFIVTASD